MCTNEKIITAGKLLSGFSDTGDALFLEQGAVHIKGGIIAAVGVADEIVAAAPNCKIDRYDSHIMLPGLVNSHHHVGLTPLQLGTLDYPLELWIGSGVARRQVDPYLDTLFSAIELLKSGVTTVQHIQGAMPGPASHMLTVASEVLRAYDEIGMRTSFCFNARNQNRLAYEPDELFVSRLPKDLRQFATDFLAKRSVGIDDYLTLFDQLYNETVTKERTKIQLAPANLHWCTDDALVALQEKAVSSGVPMHMHLGETRYQSDYAQKRTGTTAIKHLKHLGLLGPLLTLGHGVWLDAEDIEIIAETGTCICHNCSSNKRLGSGRAPVTTFLEHGITVALGIDEAGINDDRDMLLEMRLVLYEHRAPGHDSRWPSASEVLRMATEGGAATVCTSRPVGRIVSGASADCILVNEKRLFYPYQDSNVPLINALVQRISSSAIDAVYVAGNAVVRQGKLTMVDEHNIYEEIAAQLSKDRDPDELATLEFSRRIVPFLREFYRGSF